MCRLSISGSSNSQNVDLDGPCFSLETPAIKWGLTTLAVIALVAGIFGAAYGIGGLTSLSHTWQILSPLEHLGYVWISVIIGAGSVLALCALVVLICVHRREEPAFAEPREIETEVDAALKQVEPNLEENHHFQEVNKFLRGCYSGYLDHYGFYYHLACISEAVKGDVKKKESWLSFLQTIDGREVRHQNGKTSVKIDCSVEYKRLNNTLPEIVIKELQESRDSLKKDLKVIKQIFSSAFPKSGFEKEAGDGYLRHYLFDTGNKPYVVLDSSSKKILGVVVLQETTYEDQKSLFIHSLARTPNAVKVRMTEKFKEQLLPTIDVKKYPGGIWCGVEKNNLPAQKIYSTLGFKVSCSRGSPDSLYMSYATES